MKKKKYGVNCGGCRYRRSLSSGSQTSDIACHYSIDTGILRPCPADKCTVKNTSPYTKSELVAMRNQCVNDMVPMPRCRPRKTKAKIDATGKVKIKGDE